MDLSTITLQPADPTPHFASIAKLISSQETEPTSETSLNDWVALRKERGISLTVALDPDGQVLGFNCIVRHNLNREAFYTVYLIVEPEYQRQGLGSLLYDHLLTEAIELGAKTLGVRVRDTCETGIGFAIKRGFVEKKHSIEMMLDLAKWDDSRFEATLQALQAQGFHFTNMAELGDSQDARRRLYALNNNAAATDPGSDGIPPWATFEEFEQDVCESAWYHPDGQIIAIDTHTGEWAAMSAITAFDGADHAYNLFTGTDVRYRGRKLAQTVKALALRKARMFGVEVVRTSHNSDNAPMIAIDAHLGYVQTPGTLVMEKEMINT